MQHQRMGISSRNLVMPLARVERPIVVAIIITCAFRTCGITE
jgi:hypothetical protein